MRKRTVLPILVAALLTLSAGAAQAGSFELVLNDTNQTGEEVIISGLDSILNPDTLSYNGTVGQFNVIMNVTLSNPGPVAPLQMKFATFQVSSLSKGNFTATLRGTDLSSAALGPSVVGSGIASVTITGAAGAGTAKFENFVEGTSVYSRAFPGVASAPTSPLLVGSELDLVSVWDLTFNSSATMMGSSDLRVSNAAVPEPMTLLLFGPGLAGLAALRRRRARAL